MASLTNFNNVVRSEREASCIEILMVHKVNMGGRGAQFVPDSFSFQLPVIVLFASLYTALW